MAPLQLDDLRESLIRQEETIIFALIERAQFKHNPTIYRDNAIEIQGFDGCFTRFLLWETERIHARVRRYTSPDEHPFCDNLPPPILPPVDCPQQIVDTDININVEIFEHYCYRIIPEICVAGDDGHYGSSATADVTVLQALSKRIHYGKFVAESKFQQSPSVYARLISTGDATEILAALTHREVEERLYKRVELKAATYGRDIGESDEPVKFKIAPDKITDLYRQWIIPVTKQVEVDYLLRRGTNKVNT